ncbi:hypothetical protein T08_9545 [Trichinella sp. T8]|nr:hypothetical protein T08_9545 [Trichinella sp. T8]
MPFKQARCINCWPQVIDSALHFIFAKLVTVNTAALAGEHKWPRQHVAGVILHANAIANFAAIKQHQQQQQQPLFSLGFTKAMALTFDIGYLFSRPYGLLRLSQVILCLLIVICISVADYSLAGTAFVWFTSVSSLISSAIILFLYVVHFNETEMFVRVPWFMAEFVVCCFWCLFHAISGIISAVNAANCVRCLGNVNSCFGAAAFFCFAAAIAFGLCAYYLYGGWRLNVTTSNVQQQRTVTITTTTSRY